MAAMSLGGTPRCETCGKAVYHAEQVMGPARKIYHKPCLKCMQCQKRLDPGALVQHDSMPYCSRCHTQLFGTKLLRNNNLAPTRSNPSSPSPAAPMSPPTSSRPLPATPNFRQSISSSPRPKEEFYTPPRLDPNPPSSPSLNRADVDPDTEITRPNFRQDRPISIPFAGGTKALDERGLLRRGDSPRSKVGERLEMDDRCWGCEKRVYAAEQVFAVGHKWHRGCLRCTSCKTTLDPAKLSDRDGAPYCKHCYAKEHGPSGIMNNR